MKLKDFIVEVPEEKRKTVVIPLANDPDNIKCVSRAIKLKLANFLLIGEEDKIKKLAAENGADVSAATFVYETDEAKACELAAQMIKEGKAHVMMKGLVQTSSFLKAILNKENGFVPEGNLISHVGLFELPAYHKLVVVTDAAINIAPELEDKVKILSNAVDFARKIGIEKPKVACVAPVEKVKDKIPSTVDAHNLKNISGSGIFENVLIDGPFGLDIAVSKEAAEIKGIDSEVAGDPDILLMPDLGAANVLYKSMIHFASAHSAGAVCGTNIPIVLTSRADDEETKLMSVALAVHLAGKS